MYTTKTVRKLGGLAALLCAAISSLAAPSVSWVSTPYYIQTTGQWYAGPQARGENCVVVKVDIAAGPDATYSGFSWVGTGAGNGVATSHANYCLAPSNTGVQIFRAVAQDASGVDSAPIYWVAKAFPGGVSNLRDGSNRPYTVAFSDLPKQDGARIMPFANNDFHDKNLLESVICSLTGDHTTGKVLEFGAQCYRYNLGGTSGLEGFNNVGNLTLRSSSAGQATLKWNSTNPDLSGFFAFDKSCRSIVVDNLQFDTEIRQRWLAGSHLLIRGSNITVKNCRLYHAPGFAIYIGDGWNCGAGEVPDNVHIDANIIADTFSDGIHVTSAKNLYIVGNVISATTDDAIALINDSYDTADAYHGALLHYQSSKVNILWNYIERSGWRGIAVQHAIDGLIDHNTIQYTASYGIEITGTKPASPPDCPRRIDITNNTVTRAGWYPNHSEAFEPLNVLTVECQPLIHGIFLSYFNQLADEDDNWVYCTGNTSNGNSGDGYSYRDVNRIHFGNADQGTSYDQP